MCRVTRISDGSMTISTNAKRGISLLPTNQERRLTKACGRFSCNFITYTVCGLIFCGGLKTSTLLKTKENGLFMTI